MIARLTSSRTFRAGAALLVAGTIPFVVSLVKLRGAVAARGDRFTAQATVIAVPSEGVVEIGYLDRERTPRTATMRAEGMRAGQTVHVVVSEDDPGVVWLEHESPPGIAAPALLGLAGIALWLAGGTLTAMSLFGAVRTRTDRVLH